MQYGIGTLRDNQRTLYSKNANNFKKSLRCRAKVNGQLRDHRLIFNLLFLNDINSHQR